MYEDPGEPITEPQEPVSEELKKALAEYGVPLSYWKPIINRDPGDETDRD